jgi:riboflavin synthase
VAPIFTGIVEELGVLKNVQKGARSSQLNIQAEVVLEGLHVGDSIAVDGVCLTVVSFDGSSFVADVMPETMEKTTLRQLHPGQRVNLERALQVGDRLGGHLVQGHVDGIGTIRQQSVLDIATLVTIAAPREVLRYCVHKGSITVDGISLTITGVDRDVFSVSLIPHTYRNTTMGFKKVGDSVNLETDIIGRYIEKYLQAGREEGNINMGFLAENGFI